MKWWHAFTAAVGSLVASWLAMEFGVGAALPGEQFWFGIVSAALFFGAIVAAIAAVMLKLDE